MLVYFLASYLVHAYLMLNLKFPYLVGLRGGGGWNEIETKANSGQLKLELGLSLAIRLKTTCNIDFL